MPLSFLLLGIRFGVYRAIRSISMHLFVPLSAVPLDFLSNNQEGPDNKMMKTGMYKCDQSK